MVLRWYIDYSSTNNTWKCQHINSLVLYYKAFEFHLFRSIVLMANAFLSISTGLGIVIMIHSKYLLISLISYFKYGLFYKQIPWFQNICKFSIQLFSIIFKFSAIVQKIYFKRFQFLDNNEIHFTRKWVTNLHHIYAQ